MKVLITVLAIILSSSIVIAQDLQLVNPDFLGQPTTSSIKPLLDKKTKEVEPYTVSADVKCGIYIAASVFYPKKVTFVEAKESLNRLYRGHELQLSEQGTAEMAIWRIEEKKFSVSLVQEGDHIRIMYFQFQPTKEVMKIMMNVLGGNTEAMEYDCKEADK